MAVFESHDQAMRSSKYNQVYGILGSSHLIVWRRGRNPYISKRDTPGIPIRKATTKEIDSCRRWEDE